MDLSLDRLSTLFLTELSQLDAFAAERESEFALDSGRDDPDVRRLIEAMAFFSARRPAGSLPRTTSERTNSHRRSGDSGDTPRALGPYKRATKPSVNHVRAVSSCRCAHTRSSEGSTATAKQACSTSDSAGSSEKICSSNFNRLELSSAFSTAFSSVSSR